MAGDSTTLFVPGKGTIFTADPNTVMPETGISAFTLAGAEPTGWTGLGHTSIANTIGFTIDGGDATVLGTWLDGAVRTIYADTNWGLTANELQVDKPSLDLAFNGWFDADNGYVVPGANQGTPKALFVLCQDGTGQLGFYIPNTSVKLSDSPVFDTANFLEMPIAASFQSADQAAIAPNADGRAGLFKIYKTGLVAPTGGTGE